MADATSECESEVMGLAIRIEPSTVLCRPYAGAIVVWDGASLLALGRMPRTLRVGPRRSGRRGARPARRTHDGAVESLAEKPHHRELVSAGICVLEPVALAHLVRDEYCDMPTLLTQLIEAGRTVGAFQIHEDWLDIGRPDDLERARAAAKPSGS